MKILLVPDVKGWAWYHMAMGLKKYAHAECDVVCGGAELDRIRKRRYDAILQYSWVESVHPQALNCQRSCTLLASHGAEYPWPPESDSCVAKIATAQRNQSEANKRLLPFDSVLCVSERLFNVAKDLGANAHLVIPGVDDETFYPEPKSPNVPPVVGWCGQASGETKGYDEILVPVMRRNLPVGFDLNTRGAFDALSPSQMREWYNGIDVLLCTSCSEGSPMPPYEAMACGVPVISTDVGSMDTLVAPETGYVIPAWSSTSDAPAVVDTISEILSAGHNWVAKGKLARERICDEFTWRHRAAEWIGAMF